jgi:hypothetical protein
MGYQKSRAKKFLDNFGDDIRLWEMSNFRPKSTGLPMVIWLNFKSGREKHGPRLKVSPSHGDTAQISNWQTVTISDDPKLIGNLSIKDFKLVKQFILNNKDLLIKFWNDEIDISDFIKLMKKI